jgi:signal transduction histidine kinase
LVLADEKITLATHRFTAAHLDERIDPSKWPEQSRALAAAFDGMLNRPEDSFPRLYQFSADVVHELSTPINLIALRPKLPSPGAGLWKSTVACSNRTTRNSNASPS